MIWRVILHSKLSNISLPQDKLFVDASVYEWRALDELAVAASYCVAYKAAGKAAIQKMIIDNKYPTSQKERILANEKFFK